MAQIPEIVPISDLRQDAAALIRRVHNSNEPLVISQRGRASAVLVSIEEYQKREKEIEILTLLAKGEQEIAAGKGYDLDSVLKEADSIIHGESD